MRFARLAIGVGLLAALFYFRLIDIDRLRLALAHPAFLTLAILACVMMIPIAGLRWHLLLRSQGLTLPIWHTIRIVALSLFFANFLPGSAGGDIVRGIYIYQASHGRRTGALLSIFIDRLIGLAAFILFGVVATLLRPHQGFNVFECGIFVFAALFLVGIAVLFLFGHPIAQRINPFFVGRSHRLVRIIDDGGAALREYSRQWRTVLLAFTISLALVLLTAAAIVIVTVAMQLGGLSMLEYGIAGIYATIANSLPLTPGGLGIGEGAFASACAVLEPTTNGIPYGTIFLLFRCTIVISTLPGLAVYLMYPQRANLLAPVNTSTEPAKAD